MAVGSDKFLTVPSRGRIRIVTAMLGVTILAVVVLLVQRVSQDGQHPADTAPQRAATATTQAAVASPSPPGDGEDIVADGAQQLLRGDRTANGVAVGYPHTELGAVSAAVEYATQLGSTLDPQRAAQIGAVTADASFGDTAATFAQTAVAARRGLGVAADGPVPPGVSVAVGAVAYQVRNPGADRVTVLLLVYLTRTTPASGVRTGLMVVPGDMVWHDGDWKLTNMAADAPDYAEIRRTPGTPEARAAGWRDITL